jgi:hypothetical protein
MLSHTGLRPDIGHTRHPNRLVRRARATCDPHKAPDPGMQEKVRGEYSVMKPGRSSVVCAILGGYGDQIVVESRIAGLKHQRLEGSHY